MQLHRAYQLSVIPTFLPDRFSYGFVLLEVRIGGIFRILLPENSPVQRHSENFCGRTSFKERLTYGCRAVYKSSFSGDVFLLPSHEIQCIHIYGSCRRAVPAVDGYQFHRIAMLLECRDQFPLQLWWHDVVGFGGNYR